MIAPLAQPLRARGPHVVGAQLAQQRRAQEPREDAGDIEPERERRQRQIGQHLARATARTARRRRPRAAGAAAPRTAGSAGCRPRRSARPAPARPRNSAAGPAASPAAARSRSPPARRAASPTSIAATPSWIVAGSRWPISCSTGSLLCSETPRSPCSAWPSQSRYCVSTGRSSPSCAESARTCSGVAFSPSSARHRAAGDGVDHRPDAGRGEQHHRHQLQQPAQHEADHGADRPRASRCCGPAAPRPERAPERVERQDGQRQHDAGQHRVGRRVVEVGLAGAQHVAPARRRRRDADAEEGQRRLQQDGDRGQHHRLHQDRAPGIRQHGAEQRVEGRAAERLDRGDEVARPQRQRLGADHPREARECR